MSLRCDFLGFGAWGPTDLAVERTSTVNDELWRDQEGMAQGMRVLALAPCRSLQGILIGPAVLIPVINVQAERDDARSIGDVAEERRIDDPFFRFTTTSAYSTGFAGVSIGSKSGVSA